MTENTENYGMQGEVYPDDMYATIEGEINTPKEIYTSEGDSYLTGRIITPQMFGAKGDGYTDDSVAIRRAIAALPRKGGTLYFPPGVYIHGGEGTDISYDSIANADGKPYKPNVYQVSEGGQPKYKAVVNNEVNDIADVGRDIRFYFGPNEKGENYENLTILGYGAEIRSNDNNGQNRNNAMFMFYGCNGVKIKGLKLDGRRQARGIVQDDYIPGPINEFLQCNITFSYHCNDILIEDVTSINSVHDGISIGWTNNNVKIINCVCDNAQRNGIAICGCQNVLIDGCQCNDNGISEDGYRGIAPKCGIDIEAHPITDPSGIIISKNANINVHVSNCSIERNVNLGFSIYRWANNISIEKCFIKDNPQLSLSDNGEVSETYIRDCTIINSRLYSGFTVIENNTIEQHYIPGATYTNGYSFDDDQPKVNASLPHTCRNNTFKFVIDDESEVSEGAYMGIRIWNNTEFIGNRVIGAFSIGGMYPATLLGKVIRDNIFERVYTEINGYDALKVWDSVNNGWNYTRSRVYYREGYTTYNKETGEYESYDSYRDNNDFGEYYTYGATDFNKEQISDTGITKSYSFNGILSGNVYRIHSRGVTKITAKYLGQEEEVVCSYDSSRLQHILKRESTSKDYLSAFKDGNGNIVKEPKILTVYNEWPYIYLEIRVPYPMFTVSREMEYYFDWYDKNFFDEELMTNVTDDVKSNKIQLIGGHAIDMIRTCGDNTRRPHYGNIPVGTIYFDTYLEKDIWWDGTNWFDKEGNQITKRGDKNEVISIHSVFTIDGKKYYRNSGDEFKDWVKSKFNTLRIREADAANGSGNHLIVSADGNKTLYIKQGGEDKVVLGNYGVTAIESGGAYFFKDTPNANPDYSNVPVFWNGTELVTTPIYNGEVE